MTATFLDCLYDRQELLLTGYARLLKVPYNIPLDIVATCHLFLASHITIPEIMVSDSDDSDTDHLCEDEELERQDMTRHALFGKYQFIRTVKMSNIFRTDSLYQSRLLSNSKYKNNYYSLQSGTIVIVHKDKNVFNSETHSTQTLKQLQIHHIFAYHPHIQSLYDVIPSSNSLTFIYEYVGTNLYQIFRSNQFFDAMQIKYITYQILLALQHMHHVNILHGNLKPENVLIAHDCSVKICNFRHSESMNTSQAPNPSCSRNKRKRKLRRSNGRHNTYREWYEAPELLWGNATQVTTKSATDIWSVGMIFAELLQMRKVYRSCPGSRSPLFPRYHREDRSNAIRDICKVIGSPQRDKKVQVEKDESIAQYLNELPTNYTFNKTKFTRKYYPGLDDNTLDFLKGLMQLDPHQRMSVDDALEHSYLTNVRNPVYESMIWGKRKRKRRRCRIGFAVGNVKECILKEIRKYN
eukprot:257709_1